jgi:formamidopyrimidine-DNA glycosylase
VPELPEVETVRRGLERERLRAPVATVWRSKFRLRTGTHWARRHENLGALVGRTPGPVRRRGKHLLWTVRSADAPRSRADAALLIHLGMSGRVQVRRASEPRDPHTHLVVRLEDDRELRFVDPRRFGGVRFASLDALWATPPLSELGPEPLDSGFDGASLAARVGRSRRTVRSALLDQTVVAGIGNIYALEAAFLAGVDPRARCHRLRPTAWARLAAALVEVLREGIAHGGTTSQDFRGADGAMGRHQDALWVYGRGGETCQRCGSTLEAVSFEGRGGVRCPGCQPRGAGGWTR